jgi:hypothetical protein
MEASMASKKKVKGKGRGPRRGFKKNSKNRKPGHADTILSFCESEAISESLYHKLKRLGKGPREMLVEGAVRISPEAKADWRREREAENMAKRAAESARSAAPVEASPT